MAATTTADSRAVRRLPLGQLRLLPLLQQISVRFIPMAPRRHPSFASASQAASHTTLDSTQLLKRRKRRSNRKDKEGWSLNTRQRLQQWQRGIVEATSGLGKSFDGSEATRRAARADILFGGTAEQTSASSSKRTWMGGERQTARSRLQTENRGEKWQLVWLHRSHPAQIGKEAKQDVLHSHPQFSWCNTNNTFAPLPPVLRCGCTPTGNAGWRRSSL